RVPPRTICGCRSHSERFRSAALWLLVFSLAGHGGGLGWTRPLAETKEPWARPMCPGDLLGNHSQRPIAPALIFEPVLAHEDGMGAPAPLPHQRRAGLQYPSGIERKSAFLELFRQNPKAALQRPVRATAGALLQLYRRA